MKKVRFNVDSKLKFMELIQIKKMSAATYASDIDICQRVIPSETYYEPNGTYYTQIYSNSLLEQPEGQYFCIVFFTYYLRKSILLN